MRTLSPIRQRCRFTERPLLGAFRTKRLRLVRSAVGAELDVSQAQWIVAVWPKRFKGGIKRRFKLSIEVAEAQLLELTAFLSIAALSWSWFYIPVQPCVTEKKN